MEALRQLVAKGKAWYDSKSPLDKIVYTTVLVGAAYTVTLFV